MRQRGPVCLAAGLALALSVTPAHAQTPGSVHNLSFQPADDGQGFVIRWDAPDGQTDDVADAWSYEVEDRGDGAWRSVHRGPETQLRVLQMRIGACRIRVRAIGYGTTGPWSEADCTAQPDEATIAAGPTCRADTTAVCLLGNRFAVRVRWGASLTAAQPLDGKAADAERSFAFGDDKVAVTVRILDLCEHNGFFGVEYTTRSRAPFRLEVTDTQAEQDKSFAAPAGRDRPPKVRYSEVFSTCSRD